MTASASRRKRPLDTLTTTNLALATSFHDGGEGLMISTCYATNTFNIVRCDPSAVPLLSFDASQGDTT